MLILRKPAPRAEGAHGILLLGAGLIGGRIAAALQRRGFRGTARATPWTDAKAFERHLTAAQGVMQDSEIRRLDVIWSAGRAGFGSRPEDVQGEAERFDAVLDLVVRLTGGAARPTVFHLLSSAGGLFEGQRHVDRQSRPRPRRPYGELKQRLERRLRELDAPLVRRVYRLASVYGPAGASGRRGLITTLLENTRAGRTTRIVGQLTTLRDYVWTEDVARYLASACEGSSERGDRIEILASGKPTAIHEILHEIARVVGRPPAIRFAPLRDNSSDITFAPAALPAAFSPTDLKTAVHQLHSGCFDGGG